MADVFSGRFVVSGTAQTLMQFESGLNIGCALKSLCARENCAHCPQEAFCSLLKRYLQKNRASMLIDRRGAQSQGLDGRERDPRRL